MVPGVEAGVESRVESVKAPSRRVAAEAMPTRTAANAPLNIQLLGPLRVQRGGHAAALPPSRKVRACWPIWRWSSHAVARSHLCELLWDLPTTRAANCAGA